MTLEGIIALAALAVSAVAVALSIVMSGPQRLKMKAETSQIFQDMLTEEVEKSIAKDSTILTMEARMGCLENELSVLRKDNCKLRDENIILNEDNLNLKDWATRLVQQVVDARETPVKMRKRTAAT